MLKLVDICFNRNGKDILKNINLHLKADTFTVLTGPNGSGKSTLAKIIAGLENCDSGSVIFNEENIGILKTDERARRGISFAFQRPVTFKGITVQDLLDLAAGFALSKNACTEILATVGLDEKEYLHREINNSLSGGELKRIEIASVLARKSKLTIFDEPTSGLDYGSMKNVCTLIDSITGDSNASVIITHDYEFILNACNRAVLLEDGRIKEDFQLNGTIQLEHIFKERL